MANTGSTNSSSTNLQALLNQMSGSTAPSTANTQVQYQLGQDQLAQLPGQINSNLAYNQAMAGYQAQNLGLSEQGLGIGQLGLTQQGQQAATQQGLEQQEYGLQAGQYPEQQAEAALAYQNSLQQTQGNQAISGTQNTVGGRQNISTLGQQYGWQQEDIARNQALSQLGQQSEVSGYGYSQEQLQNAQANLALNAQANGLSEQQLMTMLNYGQSQTAQGGVQDLIQLLGQQSANATGQISSAGSNLSNIGFASGLNALAGIG